MKEIAIALIAAVPPSAAVIVTWVLTRSKVKEIHFLVNSQYSDLNERLEKAIAQRDEARRK